MMKMAIVLQLALLLCAWGALAQDFMLPTMNITGELGKLRSLEQRLNNMEETIQKQSSLAEQLQKENEALKTMVETMQTKLESLQSTNEVRKVAFSASLLASGSGHTGPFNSVTSPLIYKRVYTNFGNGYDSNTGIFTAPLKGVYYFRFYAHSHDGIKMAVSLYKNDKIQCSVFSWKAVSNGNASNGIVVTLEKGDKIFTKLWDKAWVYDDPGSFTSFSGFLLFPL